VKEVSQFTDHLRLVQLRRLGVQAQPVPPLDDPPQGGAALLGLLVKPRLPLGLLALDLGGLLLAAALLVLFADLLRFLQRGELGRGCLRTGKGQGAVVQHRLLIVVTAVVADGRHGRPSWAQAYGAPLGLQGA
jgi:hypothetical protein